MFINFNEIPDQPKLVLDYLYDFDKVKKFYKKNFRDTGQLENHFKDTVEKFGNRKNIVSILQSQYNGLTPSKTTKMNIEALKSPKTLAVVTGQQLGFFGGPLYTFYKIITAIKLSNLLKLKYEDYNFVPVFWLEGNDHDFDEIRTISYIDKDNQIQSAVYDDGEAEDKNRGNVGELKINYNIEKVFEQFDSTLRDSEFKEEILGKLKKFYSEGKTVKGAFKELIFDLFDENGIVIFDPTDSKVKHLLKPMFKQEIENYTEHTNAVVDISAELEDEYHAQVKVRPVNLFVTDKRGRLPLEPDENGFKIGNKRAKYSKDEILELLEKNPESFSPNVLFRPVCQDYLFPTAFYIGGPGEISYFPQLVPLYEKFNVHQPIVYPRSSVTLIESQIKNIMDKYGLSFTDLFIDKEKVDTDVINTMSGSNLEEKFSNTKEEIQQKFNELKEQLLELDKNLEGPIGKTEQRINGSLDQLYSKSAKAQNRRHDIIIRQLDKARNFIYPKGILQERELNFIYFANKYSWDFVQWLYDQISINKFEHQVIEMSE